MTPLLRKDDILRGLRQLDALALDAGMLVDLSIYGGAALVLAFDIRRATRDVDAVVNGNPDFLRNAVRAIAEIEGWPDDWLNDGVKGFTSSRESMKLLQHFEAAQGSGLRVLTPSPEYLFAMKCMAMRLDLSSDVADIEALAGIANIRDVKTALELVADFYPSQNIPAKVRFGVEEIMERLIRSSR